MKSMNGYLIFNEDCRKAMELYRKCLGGDLQMMSYGEVPGGVPDLPKENRDWIIHACLSNKNSTIMASDTHSGAPVKQGDNFFICIHCESVEEIDRYFKGLSEKGKADMPLGETFFAKRYGMLTDPFGIKWMMIYGQEQKKQ